MEMIKLWPTPVHQEVLNPPMSSADILQLVVRDLPITKRTSPPEKRPMALSLDSQSHPTSCERPVITRNSLDSLCNADVP